MWIIPSNHPLYSVFAPDCLASNEDLKELLEKPERSLMWKSKPLRWKIWSRAWKRVYWLQHLSGRILKPSTHSLFVEKYTSSLADILVSHSLMPEAGKVSAIADTFGRIFSAQSMQSDLFAVGSKTSADTSALDSQRFSKAYEILVMQLSQECLQRRKLALLTSESDCSSSPSWQTPKTVSGNYTRDRGDPEKPRLTLSGQATSWTTPVASDRNRNTQYQQGGTALSLQVKQWPTPTSAMTTGIGTEGRDGGLKIQTAIEMDINPWPTPAMRDYKGENSLDHLLRDSENRDHWDQLQNAVKLWGTPWASPNENRQTKLTPSQKAGEHGMSLAAQAVTDGQQVQDSPSTHGNPRAQLNPAWVAELMGTTLERIFFVPLVTQ